MKKRCLFCLTVCATLLSASVCHAQYGDEIKTMFRKEMIDECVKEGFSDRDHNFPPTFVVKYCTCTADRLLANYSVADLIALSNYEGDVAERFAADMEKSAKTCIIQLSKQK